MKLKGNMTILCSGDNVEIEIQDELSGVVMLRADISTGSFCAMLGRLSSVEIDMMIGELHKVGKKMEVDTLEFEMPEHNYENRTKIAMETAEKLCPKGWESDLYFGSQTSFTYKESKLIASTTIRRWVDNDKT